MRKMTIAGAAGLALVLGLGLAGCEKPREKGPAEKIGAKLDEGAREVKEAGREAKDEVEDEIEDLKD
jgi:hypothetical protein